MNVKTIVHKKNAFGSQYESHNQFENRIGFWADVVAVDTENNWVDVRNDQGFLIKCIPLISREWVAKNSNGYVSAERRIPPVNARVFILMPNGDISSAFVLCSGFAYGEESLQGLWAKSDSEKDNKANISERITQGGWDITEDARNGNISLLSHDGKIKIEINPASNSKLSQELGVKVTAWNSSIALNDSSFTVTDVNKNTVTADKDGIVIEDLNKNKIEMKSTSVTINGNLEVMQ